MSAIARYLRVGAFLAWIAMLFVALVVLVSWETATGWVKRP